MFKLGGWSAWNALGRDAEALVSDRECVDSEVCTTDLLSESPPFAGLV